MRAGFAGPDLVWAGSHSTVIEFFRWAESSGLGRAINESVWAFPVIEAVHLLGLCLLGGSVLVVDLRLLGVGLTSQTPAHLCRYARPWFIVAVLLMITTGVPLFFSEAIKLYYNTSFWLKMATLPLALAFTFVVRERVARRGTLQPGPKERIVGGISLSLWLVVAAAGRWIGFS